jgi:hypothetical protein
MTAGSLRTSGGTHLAEVIASRFTPDRGARRWFCDHWQGRDGNSTVLDLSSFLTFHFL